jgi:hypothetical protein
MGYYDYQQGLIFRRINQENGWDSHLEKCRDFILHASDIIKPEKVTVLGSGWLLELPLAELAERVKNICLVDIVHPPEVREQVKGLKNVELEEEDISGGLIKEVWAKVGRKTFLNKLSSLKEIEIPEYRLKDPGMVISLNILTQIESLPVRFLISRSKGGEDDFYNFRKEIQESHIRVLKKHKSIIITDIHEIITSTSGDTKDEKTAIAEIPEGSCKQEWRWNFDLKGEDYNRKRSVFDVVAIIL